MPSAASGRSDAAHGPKLACRGVIWITRALAFDRRAGSAPSRLEFLFPVLTYMPEPSKRLASFDTAYRNVLRGRALKSLGR